MSADNAREGIARKHCALTGTASGNHIVGCAGIQQNCCENTHLNVGELRFIVRCVHAVVEYLKSHGLYYFLQGITDHGVFRALAVLID